MEAADWISSHVDVVGEIEVGKERPWSTVWRVPTRDGDVWFKICKSIWAFEPRLTAVLARRWPDRLPEVLAFDEDRAWLLLRDAGQQIEKLPNAEEVWLDAVRLYAELQHGEAEHVDGHLAHGVPDLRLTRLPTLYADMLARTEVPFTADERERLRRFEPRFTELCDEVAGLGVPETIQHDDLHILNVYERDGRPLLLDWGDSCIQHPWFSLVVTFMFVDAAQHDAIRDAYLPMWSADREAFDLALRVGRIAHVFKWIRFRDELPESFLADYDGWFRDWLVQAVAQTGL